MSTSIKLAVSGTHSFDKAFVTIDGEEFTLRKGEMKYLNLNSVVKVKDIAHGGPFDENYKDLAFVDNADAASAGGAIYLVGDTKELGAEGFELNRRFASLYNFLESMSGRDYEKNMAKEALHKTWAAASISYRRRDEDEPA